VETSALFGNSITIFVRCPLAKKKENLINCMNSPFSDCCYKRSRQIMVKSSSVVTVETTWAKPSRENRRILRPLTEDFHDDLDLSRLRRLRWIDRDVNESGKKFGCRSTSLTLSTAAFSCFFISDILLTEHRLHVLSTTGCSFNRTLENVLWKTSSYFNNEISAIVYQVLQSLCAVQIIIILYRIINMKSTNNRSTRKQFFLSSWF